jgi:hypothetical protein
MRYGPPLRLSGSDDYADLPEPLVERVVQRPLNRVLAFLGRSIDDVVNDPIVKNQVYGYYKLHRRVQRASEVRELERQWNRTA